MIIEHAGGSSVMGAATSRSQVIGRAPRWWRDLATKGTKSAPASEPLTPKQAGIIGHVFGLACAGVSLPCRSANDPVDRPEQFHTDVLEDLVRQCNSQQHSVGLLWGHTGHEVASNSHMDLLLRMVEVYQMPALALDARIRDTKAGRDVLEQLRAGAVGVSVCFRKSSYYHTHRPGYGITRVITAAQLDHIALVPRGSSMRAAYPACTARGERSSRGISQQLRDAVMDRARDEFKSQARRMA